VSAVSKLGNTDFESEGFLSAHQMSAFHSDFDEFPYRCPIPALANCLN
jgi:hypothetical protein